MFTFHNGGHNARTEEELVVYEGHKYRAKWTGKHWVLRSNDATMPNVLMPDGGGSLSKLERWNP